MASPWMKRVACSSQTPASATSWVLNHRAEPVIVLRSPEGMSLTNMAYGGPERRTLFCTESIRGCILKFELEVAGRPVHAGAP